MSEFSSTESVPERQPQTPILEELLSPEYLPSPQPGTSQPPSPTTPVYDPLWSPPPPPPSPEQYDTKVPRKEIEQILDDLPKSSDRSGMDTPPFSPSTQYSYESLDVTRDISDWDELSDLSDVIDEVLDSSDNY